MIYKCKNCGRNFNLKPDYCDCGNNTFVEVVENFDYSTVKTDFNAENDVNFLYNNQNSFVDEEEQTSSYDKDLKKQRTSEIIAVAVFIVVVVTALIMIFSNVSALLKKSAEKSPSVEIESYVPSDVNEFWTNSKPKSEKQYVATNSVDTNRVKKNLKNENNANASKTVSVNKNSENKIQDKKNSKVSPKNNQQNTVKQAKTQIVLNEKSKVADSSKAQKAENTVKNTISIEEYLRYKNSLRNKLFSNFPILTVQGQGSARVAFSLSSEGKLTNRRFVSQSGNKSLDDAMYHMLMRVPAYYPPPEGYDGREILMQMDFDNGHYSFAFLN